MENQYHWPQIHVNCYLSVSPSVVSDSLRPHGLWPTRLLCSWNSLGKTTGVGCHCLLQGIFLTQRLNLSFLYCRQILYLLSHQGSPLLNRVKIQQWDKLLTGSCHLALFVKRGYQQTETSFKVCEKKREFERYTFLMMWPSAVEFQTLVSFKIMSYVHLLCLHLYSCPGNRFISTIFFFRFYICALIYIRFSLSDILYSV